MDNCIFHSLDLSKGNIRDWDCKHSPNTALLGFIIKCNLLPKGTPHVVAKQWSRKHDIPAGSLFHIGRAYDIIDQFKFYTSCNTVIELFIGDVLVNKYVITNHSEPTYIEPFLCGSSVPPGYFSLKIKASYGDVIFQYQGRILDAKERDTIIDNTQCNINNLFQRVYYRPVNGWCEVKQQELNDKHKKALMMQYEIEESAMKYRLVAGISCVKRIIGNHYLYDMNVFRIISELLYVKN
jgi:hypothetical protein